MNDEPALLALYELEYHVLPHLETINQDDPAVQHCLEEARILLRRAQDILQAAVMNPQTHYAESRRFYHNLARLLPLMVALESYAPPPPDPDILSHYIQAPIENKSLEQMSRFPLNTHQFYSLFKIRW